MSHLGKLLVEWLSMGLEIVVDRDRFRYYKSGQLYQLSTWTVLLQIKAVTTNRGNYEKSVHNTHNFNSLI